MPDKKSEARPARLVKAPGPYVVVPGRTAKGTKPKEG